MKDIVYTSDSQRKVESFLIIVFSVYSLIMTLMYHETIWEGWVSVLMLGGLMSCWVVYLTRVKDYVFRVRFYTIIMQSCMILYAIHVEQLSRALPIFSAYVVFMGLYGISDVIYVTGFSAAFIFFYHGVIIKSVPFGTLEEIVAALLQVGNMFLLEYVVYLWTKRNSEGSKQLMGVIEELEHAEHSKDDFLANVSHEIRTPINTICGMSELVLRNELPYEIKEQILDIQMAGRNLMSVVRDVLDFSELQSGKMELQEEAYNITSTINDVINMSMARKNDKKIELIVDCDAYIPSALLGDEKKLRRIIMNLMDNAIKFTEEGCVTIGIGCRKESYGINLIITVRDTGIGMEEESLERLFASFSQADTSRKRQEGGMGLGLAISHALVQKMGGAITVKSKLGKGSTVKVVVPQKVLDESPIAAITNRGDVNVATYIDMEQFSMVAIRDEYSRCIINMVEQLKGRCHICRNLPELQRREEKEQFSHIFISVPEYTRAQDYFDRLARRTKLIVVLNREDEKYVTNPQILKIYKPFYILSVVAVLNGSGENKDDTSESYVEKFVTKDAHVLVVDDNNMNIRVIQGLLENYKIKVTTACSGQEALEKVLSQNYDFIFMDHMMPEMDGVETLQRIRHKVGTYYQKVPIVALTANAVAGTRETLIGEGFNDFLEKPIERSVLERVLKRNLDPEKIVVQERIYREESKAEEKAAVPNKPSAESHTVSIEKELAAKGLDVEKGILYCNGKEQYLKVLQGYCEDCEDSGLLVERLFEEKDWKNYTIAVHGMKSAMRSIGAMELSDMAKELEFAGKENRLDYIMEHHAALVCEYKELFNDLRRNPVICPAAPVVTKEAISDMPELAEDIFDKKLAEMEEAMYSLDCDLLLEILEELEPYQYRGIALGKFLTQVKRKVEMSDFVSAVEMVSSLKNK